MNDRAAPSRHGQFGPDIYARWRASSLGDITEALEHALILRLAGDLAGKRVLDVGSGDGTLSRVLAGQGASSVVGCDVDPRMVGRAVAAAGAENVLMANERVGAAPVPRYVAGQAEALPFPDRSFDVVTCITVLTFIPDAQAALAEMARVLAPGGRLILGDLGRYNVWAARWRIRGWFGAAFWRSANFRSASQLRGLVAGAGLTVRHVEGAIFYPPSRAMARVMAPLDPWLGRLTTLGAGFLAVRADKR